MGRGGTGLCQLPPGLLQCQHEHIGQARNREWGLSVMVGPSSGCPHREPVAGRASQPVPNSSTRGTGKQVIA